MFIVCQQQVTLKVTLSGPDWDDTNQLYHLVSADGKSPDNSYCCWVFAIIFMSLSQISCDSSSTESSFLRQ